MGVETTVRSPERLGEVLSRIRRDAGITQAELAHDLGVDRRYVYALESGPANLYARRLFELVELLGAKIVIVDPEHG